MKKNPGRAERRRLFFSRRRAAGKQRAKMNEYISSHKFLKKFQWKCQEMCSRETPKI